MPLFNPPSSAGVSVASPNTWTAAQTLSIADNGTTNLTVPLIISHTSSGTPANGFGQYVEFRGDDISGEGVATARLGVKLGNSGGPDWKGFFQISVNGVIQDVAEFYGQGGGTIEQGVIRSGNFQNAQGDLQFGYLNFYSFRGLQMAFGYLRAYGNSDTWKMGGVPGFIQPLAAAVDVDGRFDDDTIEFYRSGNSLMARSKYSGTMKTITIGTMA